MRVHSIHRLHTYGPYMQIPSPATQHRTYIVHTYIQHTNYDPAPTTLLPAPTTQIHSLHPPTIHSSNSPDHTILPNRIPKLPRRSAKLPIPPPTSITHLFITHPPPRYHPSGRSSPPPAVRRPNYTRYPALRPWTRLCAWRRVPIGKVRRASLLGGWEGTLVIPGESSFTRVLGASLGLFICILK